MNSSTSSASSAAVRAARGAKNPAVITVLCWFAMLLDGFDLVVLGVAIPSMMEDTRWNFGAAEATLVSTSGLVGMMLGALIISFLTDKFGRRRVLMLAVTLFSIFTFFLAFTNSVALFVILRFLAGAGLGGALPTAIALVTEFRGATKSGSASTTLMTGYHVGAVATAFLGIVMIEPLGWHSLFIAGALPALVLVPAMYFLLPESPQYLKTVGRVDEAKAIAAQFNIPLEDELGEKHAAEIENNNTMKVLLGPTFRRNTLAIWGTSFMGLLLVYGMNTWLPQIMRDADYDLGNSLAFLMVLNIGAVVGLLISGRIADKYSPRKTSLVWFVASAVFLALLAVKLPLIALYIMIFLTGVFVFSSQVLVYGFVGENHPSSVRASAMGLSAGVGRLGAISGPMLGGLLVAQGLAYPWGFFAFSTVGLIGAAIFSTSRTLKTRPEDIQTTSSATSSSG